jgi:hypothetical protein
MENENIDPFGPGFQKMLDEQRNKSGAMANEEAVFLSKQMMGLDMYGRKRLLISMYKQLGGHPVMGFILKLLMEHAAANEDYEVCAAVQEVANEMKIEIAAIEKIMTKMMTENPGKDLFLDIPGPTFGMDGN